MKLLLRRNQKMGVVGNPTFILDVRAEITEQDRTNITKYRLGNCALYSKNGFHSDQKFSPGFKGIMERLQFNMKNFSVSVNDLASGKRIVCKDVAELLSIENEIKDAALRFGQLLRVAQHFGGEEVIEL